MPKKTTAPATVAPDFNVDRFAMIATALLGGDQSSRFLNEDRSVDTDALAHAALAVAAAAIRAVEFAQPSSVRAMLQAALPAVQAEGIAIEAFSRELIVADFLDRTPTIAAWSRSPIADRRVNRIEIALLDDGVGIHFLTKCGRVLEFNAFASGVQIVVTNLDMKKFEATNLPQFDESAFVSALETLGKLAS